MSDKPGFGASKKKKRATRKSKPSSKKSSSDTTPMKKSPAEKPKADNVEATEKGPRASRFTKQVLQVGAWLLVLLGVLLLLLAGFIGFADGGETALADVLASLGRSPTDGFVVKHALRTGVAAWFTLIGGGAAVISREEDDPQARTHGYLIMGWSLVIMGVLTLVLGGISWMVLTEAESAAYLLPRISLAALLTLVGGGALVIFMGDEEPTAEDLPAWHAATVYILAPLIPALMAALYLGTKSPDSLLRWNRTQMTLGVFRVSLAEGLLDPSSLGGADLIYYNDGLTTTVSVERWGQHYALKNNGKVDASNGDDMPTQINVAAYPLLLHPRGPVDLDVAVIGFGSGVSVGTALKFPVRRVDVIELERSIPEAARFFQEVNQLNYVLPHWPYVEMDRLSIINDDGRNYLASTQQDYDVIISEPSNPWITGVSDLFTVDHWRITKQRLRPGGLYCQWVQLYELSPANIKTIYRTFASEFDHVLVLSADDRSSDTVMLGSDQPIELDLARVRTAFTDVPCQPDPDAYCHCENDAEGQLLNPVCPSEIAVELARANISSPFDIFARTLLTSRDEVMQYTQIEYRRRGTEEQWFGLIETDRWVEDVASTNVGECPMGETPTFLSTIADSIFGADDPEQMCRRVPAVLNTDDNARIEFAAPNDLIGFSRYEGYLGTIYSAEWPYGFPGGANSPLAGFGTGDDAARNYAELAMSMIAHGRFGWAGELIEQSQEIGSARETTVALEVLSHLLMNDNEPAMRIEPPYPGPEMDPETAATLVDGFAIVRDAVDEEAYGAALIGMENIPAPLRLHSGPSMRALYGFLLYKAADGSYAQYRAAIEHLEELIRSEPDYVVAHSEVYYFVARAHEAEGSYLQALRRMRQYVEARLVPVNNDEEDVPEPSTDAAPTSDANGVAPKDEHPDR